jgi:NADP-dependent 3-hydroxy acid dehydrogenase YdfG
MPGHGNHKNTTTHEVVVVLGATGSVGFATVCSLAEKGLHVRAGVRDTTSVKAKQLAALGDVDLVHSDFGDVSAHPTTHTHSCAHNTPTSITPRDLYTVPLGALTHTD